MKKSKFLFGITAMLASMVMMGCDMELRNDDRAGILKVGFGGENTFNITSIKLNGSDLGITDDSFAPSAWNAIDEFYSKDLNAGDSISITFSQSSKTEYSYKTWAIAFWDAKTSSYKKAAGAFLRGDDYFNAYVDAGFTSALFGSSFTAASAGGTYVNGFTTLTAGANTSDEICVTVLLGNDGKTVSLSETVAGTAAYSASWTITD